jgi:2-methylcitrate dehydratase PrpD
VTVLPAVFAVAEEISADGASVAEAILRGYEALGLISEACSGEFYSRGFHCARTFGAFGATVGVGHLLNLDRRRCNGP